MELSSWWLRDVLLPTALVGGACGLVWLGLGATVWRGRPRLRWRGFAALLAVALVWLGVGTRDVVRRFDELPFELFRSHVADPIPAAVQDLAVDGPAPATSFATASVRFRAPAAVRRAILQHGLPGSATRRLAARIAATNGRNARVTGRICTAQGGYVPYDPQTFSGYDKPEWAFVIDRLKRDAGVATLPPVPVAHDLFVYAELGDWGSLACIATVDDGTDVMHLAIVPLPNAPWR
ncbi:MAG: hypothetical protein JNM25_18115 [Planctomycetes bacterium]|nr:hypothetical protein [Planctomycetota bacterium]